MKCRSSPILLKGALDSIERTDGSVIATIRYPSLISPTLELGYAHDPREVFLPVLTDSLWAKGWKMCSIFSDSHSQRGPCYRELQLRESESMFA